LALRHASDRDPAVKPARVAYSGLIQTYLKLALWVYYPLSRYVHAGWHDILIGGRLRTFGYCFLGEKGTTG
jgi:hypothetical protein